MFHLINLNLSYLQHNNRNYREMFITTNSLATSPQQFMRCSGSVSTLFYTTKREKKAFDFPTVSLPKEKTNKKPTKIKRNK